MQRHSSGAAGEATAPVLDINGARATIRLNRPKHLNRLQPDDLDALLNLFDRIESDPAIRVLVLTGTGRAFSAGYDLGSIAERAANAQQQTAGSAFEILPDQRRRLRRFHGSGAGLRFPYRCRHLRDVHAGGAARAVLLQERH